MDILNIIHVNVLLALSLGLAQLLVQGGLQMKFGGIWDFLGGGQAKSKGAQGQMPLLPERKPLLRVHNIIHNKVGSYNTTFIYTGIFTCT